MYTVDSSEDICISLENLHGQNLKKTHKKHIMGIKKCKNQNLYQNVCEQLKCT